MHYISDSYGETQAGFDLMNQISGNFAYDLIGNLVKDKAMEVASMSWTAYHKREKVVKEDGTTITYRYDAMNNRIYKKVEGNGVTETTHYLRDGTGNTLAIYKNGELEELNIYGSSRLGTYNGKTVAGKRTLGNKRYELSNHLGNALVVITDNKIGIDNVGSDFIADTYIVMVVSERDYLAFGAVMAGRSLENEDYTYSFNGKELDKSTGWQDYGFRDYNPVYKRFDRVDPLTFSYPELTPYQFASNRPISGSDLDGLEYRDEILNSYDQEFYEVQIGIGIPQMVVGGIQQTFYGIMNTICVLFGSNRRFGAKKGKGATIYEFEERRIEEVSITAPDYLEKTGKQSLSDGLDLLTVFTMGKTGGMPSSSILLTQTGGKKIAIDQIKKSVEGMEGLVVFSSKSDISKLKGATNIPTKGSHDEMEFIFDTEQNIMIIGRRKDSRGLELEDGGFSEHEQLADIIEDVDLGRHWRQKTDIVGGRIQVDSNGKLYTDERSGHFWRNWTPENRKQFVDFLKENGIDAQHD